MWLRKNEMISTMESLRFLMKFVPESQEETVVIDAGASVGNFTESALEFYPKARVLAFEPTPESAALYREKHAGNANVELLECALSNEDGMAELYVNGETVNYFETNSLLPRPHNKKKYYAVDADPVRTVEVELRDLDSVVEEKFGTPDIGLLKMDLQGGELDALKGMPNLLSRQAADVVLLEAMFIEHYEKQPLLVDVWHHIAGYGYSLYTLSDVSWMNDDGQIRQGDAIFVSEKVRKRF